MRQARRLGLGVWLASAMAVPCAAAMFDEATLCPREIVFPNADRESDTYTFTLAFAQDLYTITMANRRTGTATTDDGTCATYVGGICHHYVVEAGRQTDDFYAFGLTRRGGSRFVYEEVWRDGSSASTVLVCRAR